MVFIMSFLDLAFSANHERSAVVSQGLNAGNQFAAGNNIIAVSFNSSHLLMINIIKVSTQ